MNWENNYYYVKAYDFTVKKVLLGKERNERGHKSIHNVHLQHRKAAVLQIV